MGPTSSPYNLPSLGFANASCWPGSRYHLSAVDLFLKTIQPKGLPWPTCLGPSNFHPQFRSWNFRHSWHQIHLSMKVSCTLLAIKHGFLENHLFLSDYLNAYFVPGASSEAIGALADLLPYRSNGHKSIGGSVGLHSATDQIGKFRWWFRSSAKLIPYSSSYHPRKTTFASGSLCHVFISISLYVSPHIVSPANTSHEPNFLPAIPELNGYLSLYTHIYIYIHMENIYVYGKIIEQKWANIPTNRVFFEGIHPFMISSSYPHY